MINAKLSVCCSSSAAAVPPTALRHHERRLQAEDVFGRNADAQLDSACVSAEGSATRLRGGCSPLRCAGASGLLTRRAPQAYFLRRQAHGHTEDSSVNLNCGCLLQDAWRPREHVVSAWAPFLSPNDSQGGAIGPRLSRPCKRWSQCTCHLGGTGLSVAPPTLDDSESDGCGFELLEANILRCSGGDAAGSDFDELDATSSAQRNNNHRVTDWDKLPGDDESPPRYDKSGAGRLRCDDDSTLASLLPSVIQVQTKEEQEQLSGTAAHPRALQAMFACYAIGCLVEKTWRFASSALLSLLHPSMVPVAIFSFAGQVAMFAAGPWTGDYLDAAPRVFAYNFLTVMQTLGQIGTALLLIHAFQSGPSMAASSAALIRQPWYMLFIALAAVDRLGGLATSVAFERDWVVQLAGSTRPVALANANSVLRRTELVTEIAGPFIFGCALSTWNPTLCLYVTIAAMIISIPLQIWLVFRTDKLSSQVLGRARATVTPKGFSENNHIRTEPAGSKAGAFFSIEKGWRLFLSQPVFPASLAYVMLYFNVVLGPGSLMTAFLTQRGMEASSIGLFRAACAVTGFLATFTSVPLIARLGVLKTGAVSLLMQAGSLGLAVFAYMATPFGHKGSLNLFLICVVASRLGYWMYDVVDTQIFQTATPESQAGIIGATELALCSFAELVMLSLAIVAEDVSNFGSLAVLSTIAVAGSAAVYCNWIAKPTSDQVQLFPEEFEGVNGVSSRERKTSPREELEGDELDVERWRDRWETWDGRDIGGSNNWGECVGHHSSVLMSAAPL